MAKKRVALLFGGKSVEHEVSLLSARNVYEAIDKSRYEVALIGIDKQGRWQPVEPGLLTASPAPSALPAAGERGLALTPGETSRPWLSSADNGIAGRFDVVFPVLHGGLGEDGTVQGLLKLLDVPFVGPGVLASAVGMDKDVSKRLLRDAGVPVARFEVFTAATAAAESFATLAARLGAPFFVKPANTGSSVGVSKVGSAEAWEAARRTALRFDRKILVEAFVPGREIECAVLGNDDPQASVPGEIIPTHEFYSYEAKYLDENGARLEIPARLPAEIAERVRSLAVQTFQVLGCEGMARVDFFLTPEGVLYVNEINTIPGFTQISMYPKLWEASGLPYAQLVERLIELALERSERERALETHFAL